MFPLPSPPTDTLYKFKALAGLVALLLSLYTLNTETDRAKRENIELTAEIDTYNLVNKIADEDNSISKENYIRDSTRTFALITEVDGRMKREENARYMEHGKYYSLEEYKSHLQARHDAAVDKRNADVVTWGKSQDALRKSLIKIKQRKALKNHNDLMSTVITAAACVAITIAIMMIINGFKQWQVVQDLNDELTRLQVEKARKDLEAEKEPKKETEEPTKEEATS